LLDFNLLERPLSGKADVGVTARLISRKQGSINMTLKIIRVPGTGVVPEIF
jgi:hypothetical protein